MKKFLIGALVGAIIIFMWQAVANMTMSHHNDAYNRVPNEQVVYDAIKSNITKEGQYMIPGFEPNGSAEEREAYNKANLGKPWAMITYHPKMTDNMGMRSIRSITSTFLSVLIFIWILGKNPGSFGTIVLKSIALGLLMFMSVWYPQNIWMETPWGVIKGELIDLPVAWGLCGIWLGWWLNRKRRLY